MTAEINDNKVNRVNSTLKKITVKHYLNLYIRPYVNDEQEEKEPNKWKHAVYVRITFNRITAKIKSAANLWCTLNEFENQTKEIEKILERESLFLIDFISRAYNEVKDNKEQDEFNVNELFYDFQYFYYELDKVIDRLLAEEIKDYLKLEPDSLDFQVLAQTVAGDYSISPLELLRYFETQKLLKPGIKQKFSEVFWTWKILYKQFKLRDAEYGLLGASVLDYAQGDFKKRFVDTLQLDPQRVAVFYQDIDYLLDKYYFAKPKALFF